MNTEEPAGGLFFRTIPALADAGTELDESARQYIETLTTTSQMMDASIYVADFYHACFRYVSRHHLFLCGYSPGEVLQWGYEFYPRIVQADLHLLADMHQAVYHYLHRPETQINDIDYIACNFRIGNGRSNQMICHKTAPLLVNGRPQLAVCTVTESVLTIPGNLVAYYKDQTDCERYNSKKEKWEPHQAIRLTPQEKRILKLARQGMNQKQIAHALCVNLQTIKNEQSQLYQKLGVCTMQQAIIFARNHHLDIT